MTGLVAPDGVSDEFMRVFAQVVDERFSAIPVSRCLVWDIRNTPDAALAHIAVGLGLRRVLGRQSLRTSLPYGVALMKRRGTSGGLKAALGTLGYTVSLRTRLYRVCCDGSMVASGEPYRCGSDAVRPLTHVLVWSTTTLSEEEVRGLWVCIGYFGRGSVRHVLVVNEPSGCRVFRERSVKES